MRLPRWLGRFGWFNQRLCMICPRWSGWELFCTHHRRKFGHAR